MSEIEVLAALKRRRDELDQQIQAVAQGRAGRLDDDMNALHAELLDWAHDHAVHVSESARQNVITVYLGGVVQVEFAHPRDGYAAWLTVVVPPSCARVSFHATDGQEMPLPPAAALTGLVAGYLQALPEVVKGVIAR